MYHFNLLNSATVKKKFVCDASAKSIADFKKLVRFNTLYFKAIYYFAFLVPKQILFLQEQIPFLKNLCWS